MDSELNLRESTLTDRDVEQCQEALKEAMEKSNLNEGPKQEDLYNYYVLKINCMKLYLLYKKNKEFFPTMNCCDKCYIITKSCEPYYVNNFDKEFKICDMCFNDIKLKEKYSAIVPKVDDRYSFCKNVN